MVIINGKAIAQKVLSEIKSNLNGKQISLAAISVSSELAIKSFIDMKKKYAESLGMELFEYCFEPGVPEDEVLEKIKELSQDKKISGMIVEIPLAHGYDQEKILNAVPVEKDIDVLAAKAQENFYKDLSPIYPPAVRALEMVIDEYKVGLKDKTAAVFGQSILIGAPISHWLEKRCKKVYRIDTATSDPEEMCKDADIIVSGVGQPNLIKGEMVKDGAIVIDFGFEKLQGKYVGDVDFDSVSPKASLITPVPGGMGPLVIAAFLENAQKLADVR